MRYKPLLVALMLALLVEHAPRAHAARPALPFVCSSARQVMVHIDSILPRRDSTWDAPPVGRMFKYECHTALGRDANSEWILVPFGTTHAWVHRNDVRFADGSDISQLPLVERVPQSRVSVPASLPGIPAISPQVRQMYQQAVRTGRDPDMIAVVGDCNAEPPVFFGRLAAGAVNLSAYPELARIAQRFRRAFARLGVATNGGFNTASPLDPLWSDPKRCNRNEPPLDCELRLSNASLVVVSLGTGDTFTWREFEANYRAVIERILAAKAVPLLMTKADALESLEGGAPPDHINNVIRRLGAQYGLPVIDYAQAARLLPNNGLVTEYDDNLRARTPFHVDALGADVRLIMLLQTLNALGTPAPQSTRQPALSRQPLRRR
ncbi:MAG: SGNH/GDSL hydrolase family protein [Anaerolineae bacterium]|nr:SGNH/GDSL hydrolase family protein [Anaerolineae bacterium]